MHRRTLATVSLAGAALAAACSKPPVPLAATPKVNQDSLDRARADSITRARARAAELARQQAEQDSLRLVREREQREAAQNADAMQVLQATVYYDFDQASLTEAGRALMLAKVPVLQARPTLHIRITGHTDDRGSAEYNLALGLRRAAEAKAFLVSNGIDASRIETSSMGEEDPAVQGETEDAWSKNRRAEFAPLPAGGTQ
jgi:peptidoglycan-associated lipoprotein